MSPLHSLPPGQARTPFPSCTHLQVTVLWGQGAQVGVTGLVQQLCEESPRELLRCEWVLEDRGGCRLVSGPQAPAFKP